MARFNVHIDMTAGGWVAQDDLNGEDVVELELRMINAIRSTLDDFVSDPEFTVDLTVLPITKEEANS